jgi:hypothetical protein
VSAPREAERESERIRKGPLLPRPDTCAVAAASTFADALSTGECVQVFFECFSMLRRSKG